jgi:hypothetical protein
MAQAAAAAQAATRSVRETADKQFATTLKTVEPLKSVDFNIFWRQLTTAADRNDWSKSILDEATPELAIVDIDAPTDIELKFMLDKKNAFHILIDRTMHHKVGSLLESKCTVGD